MLRDLRLFRRNSGKNSAADRNNENVPEDPADSSASQLESDPSRPPLNSIQEPVQNPKAVPDQETLSRRNNKKTPSKSHTRGPDSLFQFRTPEKPTAAKSKFGWVPRREQPENSDESLSQGLFQLPPPPPLPSSHALSSGNGVGYCAATPGTVRTGGKASSVQSCTSTAQSTPTKSVTKPMLNVVSSARASLCGGNTRAMNFLVPSKGMPMSCAPPSVYAPAEEPHFELKEDPSFWMDHNVQVVIRVRPMNSVERSLHAHARCLKQESSQSITWVGQSDTRFTFDYVACETINQEMLFRVAGLPMVENCMSGYNSCVFAYGQTGSGKTYTMLGEINDLEIRPSANRGMTPRIFEFLFARIKAEEESRRDEKLQYRCKCSFLEIYNEQITDLLNPSSTNLLIREDLRKGVYVENLTEYEVQNVNDILNLLIQGAANRKIAATNMNHESSRSHSVFTCTIKSKWEKDVTNNSRFARLNLVDLAGSERQKTSGAEGDRLKEAVNINKSLSTLGHVIMVLADVANGRQRHVPYRDSRLTFLLQDSLGGNSKTMIIANVSPSICSANETLSTLKFAQRAKLIQNNAVVNEDASGDVLTLQHQVHLLKAELSLLKCQNVSRSLSFRMATLENTEDYDAYSPQKTARIQPNVDQRQDNEALGSVRVSTKKLKSLEATLVGALRREKMADAAMRQLEAEIEQLNRLVRQREEDTQGSKMMIKFREDKILRMESLLNGLLPSESYLFEENNALSEEIKMLRAKVDRNPEVTRFAMENIRLSEQLRRFQDFYEEGERELLLAEVSELRNQVIQVLDGNSEKEQHSKSDLGVQEIIYLQSSTANEEESLRAELKRVMLELDDCRNSLKSCLEINEKLTREINNLNTGLKDIDFSTVEPNNIKPQEVVCKNLCLPFPKEVTQLKHAEENLCLPFPKEVTQLFSVKHAEEVLNLELELDILKAIVGEEKSSRIEAEERAIHADTELNSANEKLLLISKKYDKTKIKIKDARTFIEALESQQMLSINELEELREKNSQLAEALKEQQSEISTLRKQLGLQLDRGNKQAIAHETLKKSDSESGCSPLQEKLKRVQVSLEKAWTLNMRYQTDQASLISNEKEMDEVHRQVEAETAEVIICLQEELTSLHQLVGNSSKKELLVKQRLTTLEHERKEQDDKLFLLSLENTKLSKLSEEKEQKLRSIMEEWEELALEIADLLEHGNADLDKSSSEVASIFDVFSQRSWISEQFGKIIRVITEKDFLIEELQKNLEDAHNIRDDMELKLRSLRGATLAITEAQQQESSYKENRILHLTSMLSEKMSVISELEDKIEHAEEKVKKAEICSTIAFVTVIRLSDINKKYLQALDKANLQLRESENHILQKESIIQNHISLTANKDTEVNDLRAQIEQYHQQDGALEQQAYWKNEEDLIDARMTLKESQMEMSTLKSCMLEYTEKGSSPVEEQSPRKLIIENSRFKSEDRMQEKIGSIQDISFDEQKKKDIADTQITIEILRKEMKLALESLKEVQSQMAEMIDEREEIKKSMLCSHDSIKCLTAEVLQLNLEILDKEKEFEFKLLKLEENLQTVEGNAMAFNCCWRKEKEDLELEISNLKAVTAQKTIETSNLLIKIEEAQETMREADVMVNALMEANEISKLEIERLKKAEISLYHENFCLAMKQHNLQASLDEKDENLDCVQKNFMLHLIEAMDLVLAMEDQFMNIKDAFAKKFTIINCELDRLKNQIFQHTELARVWFEEIWLGIIGKDCALSVLHLCLVGILLEKITGLNVENCFLHVGLCESNSLVTNLRDQNVKAEKELQMCSFLKGNLLLDIKKNFDRITNQEIETCELSAKLNSFEKKILGLQCIEETMLDKSNFMVSELDVLKEELSANTENALRATAQEELVRENEETNKRLVEMSMLLKENKIINKTLRDELEMEFNEKIKVTESLGTDLFNMDVLITQRNHFLEDLKKEIVSIKHEKNYLESHVATLNKKLEETEALVDENEAIAAEKLKNLFMENEELKLRLTDMSKVLDEVQCINEEMSQNLRKLSDENTIAIERLEKQLLDARVLIGQRDFLVEQLKKDISRIAIEKDHLESEAYILKEKPGIEKSIAEKNDAAAVEASQKQLLVENEKLKLKLEQMTRMLGEVQSINQNLDEESKEKMVAFEMLKKELFDSNILLTKRSHLLHEFQKEMNEITRKKEQLESEVSSLEEKLELAESLAEENEAVATEARQIAQERKAYAQVKEEEVKLLERSVEELECTINALQEQVRIVKDEAERQVLQRNVLGMEREAVENSNNVWNFRESEYVHLSRQMREKVAELEGMQHNIQLLQKEVAEKEVEIVQCRSLISELNLHAEVQAREYKRKFMELEAIALDVKNELASSNATSLTSTKSEKCTGRSKGSGSPFKCIGLGLAQQINTEMDEELTTAKHQIEELEALASSRQKQIFLLNIRLAAAESMTHDVLRDLLGIKLDMTKYAKINEQSQTQCDAAASMEKEQLLGKLKNKVDEFMEERQSFLDQINQRHRELIAAQITLEKLQEQERLLITENELLKIDNAKYKNIVMELEVELEKIQANRISSFSHIAQL